MNQTKPEYSITYFLEKQPKVNVTVFGTPEIDYEPIVNALTLKYENIEIVIIFANDEEVSKFIEKLGYAIE